MGGVPADGSGGDDVRRDVRPSITGRVGTRSGRHPCLLARRCASRSGLHRCGLWPLRPRVHHASGCTVSPLARTLSRATRWESVRSSRPPRQSARSRNSAVTTCRTSSPASFDSMTRGRRPAWERLGCELEMATQHFYKPGAPWTPTRTIPRTCRSACLVEHGLTPLAALLLRGDVDEAGGHLKGALALTPDSGNVSLGGRLANVRDLLTGPRWKSDRTARQLADEVDSWLRGA